MTATIHPLPKREESMSIDQCVEAAYVGLSQARHATNLWDARRAIDQAWLNLDKIYEVLEREPPK